MSRSLRSVLVAVSAFVFLGATEAPGVKFTVDRTRGTVDVRAVDASLGDLVQLASLRSGVFVTGTVPERRISFLIRDVPVDHLVERVVHEAGLALIERNGTYRVIDPAENVVYLDVVDAEVGQIVRSLAAQCGISNVMIDPGVKGKGTFILTSVPCSSAFPLVFRTLGIGGELHPNSVLVVRGSR